MTHRLTYKDKPIWFTIMGKPRCYLESCSKKKQYQPLVHSRINKDTWLIFADFDVLPADFQSWDGLREYLETLPCHVFKSFSGKPKAAILVKSPSMSANKAIDTLKSVFGDLAGYVDAQGMLTSFVRPEYFAEFSDWVSTTEPIQAIHDRAANWRLKPYEPNKLLSHNENLVLHFATSYEGMGAFSIPQTYVAEQMGLSVSAVNRAIRSLVEKKLLRLEDRAYTPGRSAMKYSVLVLKTLLASLQGIVFKEPPTFIPDGEWYRTIWACTNLFDSKSRFISWLESLPGLMRPGKRRLNRAMKAWATHEKRRMCAI